MKLSGIFTYSYRALIFAVIVGVLWSGFYVLLHKRRREAYTTRGFICGLLFVCYCSALVQITVIRDFEVFCSFANNTYSWESVALVPFETTSLAWKNGLWSFIYHVIGNAIWFVPLGVLIPLRKKRLSRLKHTCIIALLLSIGIEVAQWIFDTGVSDIDDVIFNVLGAIVGWLMWNSTLIQRTRERKIEQHTI